MQVRTREFWGSGLIDVLNGKHATNVMKQVMNSNVLRSVQINEQKQAMNSKYYVQYNRHILTN